MISCTIEFFVSGEKYQKILSTAVDTLAEFFDMTDKEVLEKVSFEIILSESEVLIDFDDEYSYTGKVIAKVKNVS